MGKAKDLSGKAKDKNKVLKPDKNVIYLLIDNPYRRHFIDLRRDYGGAEGSGALFRLAQWIHWMAGNELRISQLYFRKQSTEVIIAVPVKGRDPAKIFHMLGHHKWSRFVDPTQVKGEDLEKVSSVYVCKLEREEEIDKRGFDTIIQLPPRVEGPYHQFLPRPYPHPYLLSESIRFPGGIRQPLPAPPPEPTPEPAPEPGPSVKDEPSDAIAPPMNEAQHNPVLKHEPIEENFNTRLAVKKEDPWAHEAAANALLRSALPTKEEERQIPVKGEAPTEDATDLWSSEEARNALRTLKYEEAAEGERAQVKPEVEDRNISSPTTPGTRETPLPVLPPDEPGIMRIFDDSDDEEDAPRASHQPLQNTTTSHLKRVKPEEDPDEIKRMLAEQFALYNAQRAPSPQRKSE